MFSNITKKHIIKKSRNSKLKGKYYINEKTYLATEKNVALHCSLKINKQGGHNKIQGWSKSPPFIRHLRVFLFLVSKPP